LLLVCYSRIVYCGVHDFKWPYYLYGLKPEDMIQLSRVMYLCITDDSACFNIGYENTHDVTYNDITCIYYIYLHLP
jgi:hypothetical protein